MSEDPPDETIDDQTYFTGYFVAISVIGLGAVVLVTFLTLLTRGCGGKHDGSSGGKVAAAPVVTRDSSPPPDPEPPLGLDISRLKLTAVSLSGHWKESDVLVDDSESWLGSACVLALKDNHLILITNFHCLGLQSLMEADDDGSPEVAEYSLVVHFPHQQTRDVQEFGVLNSDLDLAWISVNATGLTDYECLGMPVDIPPIPPGVEVVAVGSPIDMVYEGTHTFGRVSASRTVPDSLGNDISYIQTDAAINHGNSGGPLFVKVDDRYVWAGVVVAKVDAAESLGLAIGVGALLRHDPPLWFDATPRGVMDLFNEAKGK